MSKKIVAGRPYKSVDDLSKAGISATEIRKINSLVTVGPASDPFDLPRIDAGYLRKLYWLSNLNTGLGSAYVAAQRRVAAVRALLAKPG